MISTDRDTHTSSATDNHVVELLPSTKYSKQLPHALAMPRSTAKQRKTYFLFLLFGIRPSYDKMSLRLCV